MPSRFTNKKCFLSVSLWQNKIIMSAPHWKNIGEAEYARLAAKYPIGTLRDILRAVKGTIIRNSLRDAAADEVSDLVHELEKEFQTGPALMILRAADQSAAIAERAQRPRHPSPQRRRGTEAENK